MRLTLKNIEEAVAPLGGKSVYGKEIIYDLLGAYGRSPNNITRLKNGSLNVAEDTSRDVAQKSVVYFRPVTDGKNLYATIDELKTDRTVVRYSTRFVIVTDYEQLLAIDTKTNETLDIPLRDLNKHFTFFLPWAGMEKTQYVAENQADIKAAYKMSKLFDEIVSFNHHSANDKYYHSLNVFFSRLLFCFFAEDTDIFSRGLFTNAIESHTQEDGSDLADYLDSLFTALDIENKQDFPSYIAAFPYVNGGLFHSVHKAPKFNMRARQLILECGKLDWSEINPDIFGSMIQAVVHPGQRAVLGMHYTSVPNIMKTIEPLFMDELKDEFNKHYDNKDRLQKLLGRIGNIKIFDPACGSGNFLVIAYKELRKLEHALLERIADLTPHKTNSILFSCINIENFYGIEIDDFASEVAVLSMWLAKHQMNIEFKNKFGTSIPLIPLKESGNIKHGNAALLDWKKVCPNEPRISNRARLQQGSMFTQEPEQRQLLNPDELEWNEIYLIGNPPYGGARKQDLSQKKDLTLCFSGITSNYKNLDYIAIWFYKSYEYIRDNVRAKVALVSTNSITQGQQVELLWPHIMHGPIEIAFAYTSFKWANSAKNPAGITCIIVGLAHRTNKSKYLYSDGIQQEVEAISPYLSEKDTESIVGSRTKPISELPKMEFGNMPLDGGNLLLSASEKDQLVIEHPEARKYLRRIYGAKEYINDIERWCIWATAADAPALEQIPKLRERIGRTRQFRLDSKDSGTQKKAATPYRFRESKIAETQSLIIPAVSSERRDYIPVGFLGADEVVSNLAQVIYDPEPYIFGLISSRMHMTWVRAVAGRLKTDYRYSSAIVYNNFPVPILSQAQKKNIEAKVFNVLDARERNSEMTLGELYDPDRMPDGLRAAHLELDNLIDSIYTNKPFANDEERLTHLFSLYEQMTAKEKDGALV